MNNCDIRFAKVDEYGDVKAFLNSYWDPEFAVVRSKKLFDYLYLEDNRINFVIALRDSEIVAVLGLIFYGAKDQDVFLALWRSIDKKGDTGIDLINFVLQQGYSNISSVGVRKEVIIIYKVLGFVTGKMDHFVKLNEDIKDYHILKCPPISEYKKESKVLPRLTIEEVEKFSSNFRCHQKYQGHSPQKTIEYLSKRYFAHTHYKYRVFEAKYGKKIFNYFVIREVEHNGASVLRLIDCINHETGFIEFSDYVTHLLKKEGHEYIDIYCSNMDEGVLIEAGFINRYKYNNLIVPNYFEPFLQENEDKYYVTTYKAPHLYKGDGDADRPFRLKEGDT